MGSGTSTAESANAHDHDDHHHDLPFLKKYIFSTDHKIIGYQYGFTALIFLFIGFYLMMVMRWSIATPDKPLPGLLAAFLNDSWLSDEGRVTGDLYNMFGAMHGTIMVFLGIVPLAFGAFGNFVTPLQIGAPDMAFPRLNMASYWFYFLGGVTMFTSFFIPSGAAEAGWTMYSPIATTAQLDEPNLWYTGQTFWLFGMIMLISSSLLGAVNFITTIINLRCRGMTWMRLPFFVWAMMVTGFLLLLAFPPLEVAALMQLMDRLAGASFFIPTGLNFTGAGSADAGLLDVAGGGSPLLYQHLFWFLAHPEVYVLILPAIAIVGEIIPVNIRKPMWGYKSMVYAVMVLGFLAFIVWAHHMYLTGMGNVVSTFFQATTVIISIPSVVLLSCLFISLWGGSIRFTVPMLWALAFLPMFGFGGLTGLPLAFNFIDLHLHDTYYVIGHFHYIVAPGTIFGLFAGIYHWFPKATGRMMNSKLGHLHFWPSLVAMNGIFLPMMIQGMSGFHRRWYDGGINFEQIAGQVLFEKDSIFAKILSNVPGIESGTTIEMIDLNHVMTFSVWILLIGQFPFIFNFIYSIFKGKKAESDNPWEATTIEWLAPNKPGHGNFLSEPIAYRGPYEYSVPGHEKDFSPQFERGPDGVILGEEDTIEESEGAQ
ncbi:MAG: cbb3-type cytochrome c oxidase subunit I [Verrucomicrobiales bacterium]|nr:cbb3-type cytochrome c oxidase subunit I [Verrucomicrobiales bacterium]